jgi:hypothetical protein
MTNKQIPRLVYIFSVVLFVFGIPIIMSSLFAPGLIIQDWNPEDPSDRIMQGMWAGRIIASVVVLGVALAVKNSQLLAVALLMRFIIEAIDSISFLSNGGMFMGSLAGVIAVFELATLVYLLKYKE